MTGRDPRAAHGPAPVHSCVRSCLSPAAVAPPRRDSYDCAPSVPAEGPAAGAGEGWPSAPGSAAFLAWERVRVVRLGLASGAFSGAGAASADEEDVASPPAAVSVFAAASSRVLAARLAAGFRAVEEPRAALTVLVRAAAGSAWGVCWSEAPAELATGSPPRAGVGSAVAARPWSPGRRRVRRTFPSASGSVGSAAAAAGAGLCAA